jgi:hypothetical protein
MMQIFFTNYGMGDRYGTEDVYASFIFITQFMQVTVAILAIAAYVVYSEELKQ